MKLSIIAAVSKNNVIGKDNRLPWHLSDDLKNFKYLTMGKPILMGRKTFESIGRVLPGRTNIVVSRNPNFRPKGCHVLFSLDDVFKEYAQCEEIMVIGGASFYEQLLPQAKTLYLTLINKDYEGDTFFPNYDESEWEEKSRQDLIQEDEPFLEYSFRRYERK